MFTPILPPASNPSQAHWPLMKTPQLREDTQQGHPRPSPGRWTQPGGENPKLLSTSEQVGLWAHAGVSLGAGHGRAQAQSGPVPSKPVAPDSTQSPTRTEVRVPSLASPAWRPQAWVLRDPSPPPILGRGHQARLPWPEVAPTGPDFRFGLDPA